jgi:hypothetical protein
MASSIAYPDPNGENASASQATSASGSGGLGSFYLADGFQLAAILAIIILAFVSPIASFHVRAATATPVSTVALSILWFALVCGLASMATVETAKRLVALRSLYQRRQVKLWVTGRVRPADAWSGALTELDQAMGLLPSALPPNFDSSDFRLRRRALYDLPIGQLVAQISIAADLALSDPGHYRSLPSVLVGEDSSAPAQTTSATQTENATQSTESASTRIRESQLLRVALDQLQISVGERWRRYVQGTALWLSGAYGIAVAYMLEVSGRSVYILAALFIGGLFSWVARDVASGLERWHR